MKNILKSIIAIALLTCSMSFAGTLPEAKKGSAEFERLKALVGEWHGKADLGQGPVDMTVQFRLLAGGTVLEERVFPGTPHEMVTMYFDRGGKLALTHYCVIGNRPGMVLESADSNTLKFAFDELCGVNPAKETHMNAMTLTFTDANTITTTCNLVVEGKAVEQSATTLKRVNAK